MGRIYRETKRTFNCLNRFVALEQQAAALVGAAQKRIGAANTGEETSCEEACCQGEGYGEEGSWQDEGVSKEQRP
jgi:hypothetical protein